MGMRKPEDIIIDNYTLKEIIERHEKYLYDGLNNMKADLSDANLRFADLSKVNLRDANFSGADLTGANFDDAHLADANFSHANLHHTSFYGSFLASADFSYSTIMLSDFNSTHLNYANFNHSIIKHTNFSGADLTGVDFTKAKGSLLDYRKGKILKESIIGYKLCISKKHKCINMNYPIVKLEIPKGAVVFSINGNKCRTNKAKVIDIEGFDIIYDRYYPEDLVKYLIDKERQNYPRAYNIDSAFYLSYYIGDEININDFDLRYNQECSTGIHFFMTREEAIEYGKWYKMKHYGVI